MTTTLHNAKKKILIVEDEGDMCLLLNIMLQKNKTDIEHVNTLSAADEFLRKEPPDLVILDNKLPDGLGIDFIRFIKRTYPAIKIIMISGFAISVKDVALFNGADIFLEKPFTKDQLYKSVEELINHVSA